VEEERGIHRIGSKPSTESRSPAAKLDSQLAPHDIKRMRGRDRDWVANSEIHHYLGGRGDREEDDEEGEMGGGATSPNRHGQLARVGSIGGGGCGLLKGKRGEWARGRGGVVQRQRSHPS
jgi:hypothetical protein